MPKQPSAQRPGRPAARRLLAGHPRRRLHLRQRLRPDRRARPRRSAARRSPSRPSVVLDNITAILAAGGAALADVVKATVHLARRDRRSRSSTTSTRSACPSPDRSGRRSGAGCARSPACAWRSTSSRTSGHEERGAMQTEQREADAVVIGSGALGAATAFWLAKRGLRRRARRPLRPRVADVAARGRAGAEGAGRRRARRAGHPRRRRAARLRRAHRQAARRRRQRQRQDRAHRARRRAAAGGGPPRRRARRRDRRGRRPTRSATARAVAASATARARISYAPTDVYMEEPRRPCRARSSLRARRISAERRSANTEVTGFVLDDGRVDGRRDLRRADRGARSSSTPPARGRGSSAGSPARRSRCSRRATSSASPSRSARSSATHPTVRVMDARVYVRPCRGGLMFGAYEPDPLMVDPATRPPGFQVGRPRVGHASRSRRDAPRSPSRACRSSATRRSPSCAAGCRR